LELEKVEAQVVGWEHLKVGALAVAKALAQVLTWAMDMAVWKAESLALSWADSLGLVAVATMGVALATNLDLLMALGLAEK